LRGEQTALIFLTILAIISHGGNRNDRLALSSLLAAAGVIGRSLRLSYSSHLSLPAAMSQIAEKRCPRSSPLEKDVHGLYPVKLGFRGFGRVFARLYAVNGIQGRSPFMPRSLSSVEGWMSLSGCHHDLFMLVIL
jgi:hypothetical protein